MPQKNIVIHLGSWKAASTLIQVTLRKNKKLLSKNGAAFIDQNSQEHKEFSRSFREMIKLISASGIENSKVINLCKRTAILFEALHSEDKFNLFFHSWENFVGHPFNTNKETLYHGRITSWWFKKYLSHLPIRFVFITRGQADLVEAMYTQEVRKGRFLDSIDRFLDEYIYGRDLSWLPTIEPFEKRFGRKSIRVIPFERIKQIGSTQFLNEFFKPYFDFNLNISVEHANPSFSSKAVEEALKRYPGMSGEERKEEEKRLVKQFSNLKYPRTNFLGEQVRSQILEDVKKDNRILVDAYFKEDIESFKSCYFVSSPIKRKKALTYNDIVSIADKPVVGRFKVRDLNGTSNLRYFLPSKSHNFAGLTIDSKYKSVFVSDRPLPLALPKGAMVSLQLIVSDLEGLDLSDALVFLIEIVGGDIRRSFRFDVAANRQMRISKGSPQAQYALVVAGRDDSILTSIEEVQASPVQQVPDKVIKAQDSFVVGNGDIDDTEISRDQFISVPTKISTLCDLSWRPIQRNRPTTKRKKPFFITVDTESMYFERPSMMTGEGLPNSKSTLQIMELLENYSMRATFYVNVYEHTNYNDGSVEKLCKTIHERGHEVALHSHSNSSLGFYKKEIDEYDYDGQVRILEYGKELIHRWLGFEVKNFRAGAYRHNETTLRALQQLDFELDSSYFYGRSSSESHQNKFVNPYRIGSLVEVPVLYIPLVTPAGLIVNKKFDINPLRLDELKSVVGRSSENMGVMNFMMHSFSFIQRKRFNEGAEPQELLMKSKQKGRYIGVTGLDDRLWNNFAKFIEWLSVHDNVEVVRMCDSVNRLNQIIDENSSENESAPIIYR